MPQPGSQEGNARRQWWKVAKHLDDAQLALADVMGHAAPAAEDSTISLSKMFQGKLREAQAILLELLFCRGFLPPGLLQSDFVRGTPQAPLIEATPAETPRGATQEIATPAETSRGAAQEIAVPAETQRGAVQEIAMPAETPRDAAQEIAAEECDVLTAAAGAVSSSVDDIIVSSSVDPEMVE